MNEKEYYQMMYMRWIEENTDKVVEYGKKFGSLLFKREKKENKIWKNILKH